MDRINIIFYVYVVGCSLDITLFSMLIESESRRTEDMTAIKSRAVMVLLADEGSTDVDDKGELTDDNSTNNCT